MWLLWSLRKDLITKQGFHMHKKKLISVLQMLMQSLFFFFIYVKNPFTRIHCKAKTKKKVGTCILPFSDRPKKLKNQDYGSLFYIKNKNVTQHLNIF